MTRFMVPAMMVAALMLAGCSRDKVAGGATDTESGGVACGFILDSLGYVPGARVSFYPASFDPRSGTLPDSLTTVCDNAGRYSIQLDPAMDYTLIAGLGGQAGSLSSIQPGTDTFWVNPAYLRRYGTLRVSLPRSLEQSASALYIPGSPYAVPASAFFPETDSTLVAYIDSLPVGGLSALYYVGSDGAPRRLSDAVAVNSSDTADVFLGSASVSATVMNAGTGFPNLGNIHALTRCPVHGGIWIATDAGLVFHTAAGWSLDARGVGSLALAVIPDTLYGTDQALYADLNYLYFQKKPTLIFPLAGITAIVSDGNQRALIGTGAGYYLYRAGDTLLQSFATASAVRSVLFDADGNYWAAGTTGVMKTSDSSLLRQWTETELGAATSDIWSLALDSAGTVWAGSYAGELLSYKNNAWTPREIILGGDVIVGIATAPGLLCAAGLSGKILIRRASGDVVYDLASAGISAYVTSIVCSADGTIYVGTDAQGVVVLRMTD